MKINRVILIVLDSVGIGELPDAHLYNDIGSNTLGNIAKYYPNLQLPNLTAMGLGNIDPSNRLAKTNNPSAAYGKANEQSAGKDTTTGHWEICGIILKKPFPTFPNGFPKEFISRFEKAIGTRTIGNKTASGTIIINELGEEHLRTKCPIVYTSADSVFQIAMHEAVYPIEEQYKICKIAREMLIGDYEVGRVIARPFIGKLGDFNRTSRRKDFSVEPPNTILNAIQNSNKEVISIGKIIDIFSGKGITTSTKTNNNIEGIQATIKAMQTDSEGLIFTNLVDFDMLFGHRRDIEGYAKSLMEFDEQLPNIIDNLKNDDLLIITADHGNDPSAPGTDHTREYIPILTYNKLIKTGQDIGTRQSFADIAATIADALEIDFNSPGKSFFSKISMKNSDLPTNFTSKSVTNLQPPSTIDLIKKKKKGDKLTKEEFSYLINGFVNGEIPDYQISAFLMAVYFQGLDKNETAILTDVMMRSGELIDLSSIDGIIVDKHSTGGVGDKTTIVLAPLVAAAGVPVAKMSGRGLGHTGGTIDKLESIKGLSIDMSKEQFIERIKKHGIAICGQNESLVPADKKLYALRDVTGTVDNLSLISSSIMSKKLACGADAIVIDIKVGEGAYMKTEKEAEDLANMMIGIGEKMNKKVVAIISSMNEPLGFAVGNALEVKEAIDTLKGNGPKDLTELCLELGSQMLVLGQVVQNQEEGIKKLKELIDSGLAFEKLKELIKAQGGDITVIEQPDLLPSSTFSKTYRSIQEGFITELNAQVIGAATMKMGSGRATKESQIDYGAGILLKKKIGDYVKKNEPLAIMYSNNKTSFALAEKSLELAFVIGNTAPKKERLIIKVV